MLYQMTGDDGEIEVFEGAASMDVCKCGHAGGIHGRATFRCTVTGCRCTMFKHADLAINVVRCSQGHADVSTKGGCNVCAKERMRRLRAKRKLEAENPGPPPPEPGTFEYQGMVYREGDIWQRFRARGWMEPHRDKSKPQLGIQYRGP